MRRYFVRTVAMVASILISAGCYSSVEPNTEFPKRLTACSSPIECETLDRQAQRDVADCATTVTIYMLVDGPKKLACDEARRNVRDAEEKVAKLQARQGARREAELQAGEENAIQERADLLRAQRQEQAMAVQGQLATQMEAAQSVRTMCDATNDARAIRRKHADILRQQEPGAIVQKKCIPQREMQAVQSQCTDVNGFVRTCTKQVPGDVVNYFCPRTIDAVVAKLGIFQLGLGDGVFPFPEDEQIGVSDGDCDAAASHLRALQDRLNGSPTSAVDRP
jgi:hypothetical protein